MIDDAGTLIDMETRNTYDIVEEVCPILNEQNKHIITLEGQLRTYDKGCHEIYKDKCQLENKITELENLIKDKNEIQQETLNKLLKTQKENQTIRNTIQTMMDNERTHIGYNVLKQLWLAIQ